jgi:hypothetical protein
MQGTSLMVECDARPCWKKDMPAGVGLLMGNRGLGSQVGDTYIAFVHQYVRNMYTPDTLSPAAPIHPAMQRYMGSKLSVANITTDPEGSTLPSRAPLVHKFCSQHSVRPETDDESCQVSALI